MELKELLLKSNVNEVADLLCKGENVNNHTQRLANQVAGAVNTVSLVTDKSQRAIQNASGTVKDDTPVIEGMGDPGSNFAKYILSKIKLGKEAAQTMGVELPKDVSIAGSILSGTNGKTEEQINEETRALAEEQLKKVGYMV